VLTELDGLVSELFPIANSDAQYRVQVRNVILKKPWGTEVLLDKIKASGIFALSGVKKAKRVREANDKLEFALRNPQKFNEAKVLHAVHELKKRKSFEDTVLLVQICVGSRFTEVLYISQYSVSDLNEYPGHTYIRIYGVGAEQRESRRVNLERLKAKRQKTSEYKDDDSDYDEDTADRIDEDNAVSEFEPKEIIKPVLFDVTPEEIVQMVTEIRAHIRKKVTWYDELTRDNYARIQQLTNLFIQRAVKRVDVLFGARHTHLMRRIYAFWSYETYGKNDMAQLGWYKAVLGHNSSNTSRAYTTLLILPIVKAEDKNLNVEIGTVKTDQDLLKEQVEKMKEEVQDLHTFNNPPDVEPDEVLFWTSDKKWAKVIKRQKEVMADKAGWVDEYAAKLRQNNIVPTKQNLRKLGCAPSTIDEWIKKQ
jgi:hypothetical protein